MGGLDAHDSVNLPIPQGVTLYSKEWVGAANVDEDFIEEFGVSRIIQSNEIRGISIQYDPGKLIAKVERAKVSADDMNRIGGLLIEHEKVRLLMELLPEIIPATEGTVRRLTLLPFQNGKIKGVNPDPEVAALVSEQGAVIEKMKAAQVERKTQLDQIRNQLLDMGVVLIKKGGGNTFEIMPLKRL